MTRTLTIALCALTLSTPTFAHSPSEAAKVYATMPAGDGNPVVIRSSVPSPESRRKSAKPMQNGHATGSPFASSAWGANNSRT